MKTLDHMLDSCFLSRSLWEKGEIAFCCSRRSRGSPDITLKTWSRDPFSNKIFNQMWCILPTVIMGHLERFLELKKSVGFHLIENRGNVSFGILEQTGLACPRKRTPYSEKLGHRWLCAMLEDPQQISSKWS